MGRLWTRCAWEKVNIQHGSAGVLGWGAVGNEAAKVGSCQPLDVPESQARGLDCIQRGAVEKFC